MSIVLLSGEGSFADQLRDYVATVRRFGPGASIFSDLLIRKGREFTPAPRPFGIARGEPRQCFRNAAKLALRNDWDYVEGLVSRDVIPRLAFHHAWCCEPGDDTVIDDTLEPVLPTDRFWGIRFTPRQLTALIETADGYGFILTPTVPNYSLILALDPSLRQDYPDVCLTKPESEVKLMFEESSDARSREV